MPFTKPFRAALLFAVVAAAAALSACGSDSPAKPPEAEYPVVSVLSASASPLEVTHNLPGRVQAVRTAQVRARVAGIVMARLFTEGTDVKAGQVLYQIDPAPLHVALDKANAEVQRTQAAVNEAKATMDRYTPLAKIEAVSQQDLVTAQTNYQTALANGMAAQADAKSNRLNLEYATVRAPISGRIGRSLVTEGALVGQGEATALATIQQIDRVYVDLTQSVADALNLQETIEQGKAKKSGTGQSARIVVAVEGPKKKREGRLLFSDISVDPTSGQVTLRGEFPNPDGLLLPGMYVRVDVVMSLEPDALLLPQRAVTISSEGNSRLLVVGKDDILEERPVRTGQMYGGSWHILEGIKAGERVVVGGPPVSAGAKVSIAAISPSHK